MNTTMAGYIPAPMPNPLPKHPPLETFEDLALGVDVSELTRLDQLRRQATDAVAELASSRPGGEAFKAALGDDVKATLDGSKSAKLSKLLAADMTKWASAKVATDVYDVASRAEFKQLRLSVRTALRTKLTELEAELADTAAAGWAMRHDKSVAWSHRHECDRLLAKWRTARALLHWADGQPYRLSGDILPSGPTGGNIQALRWALDGNTPIGFVNDGLELPPEADSELFNRQVQRIG